MRSALEPMLAYDVSSNSVLQHVTNIRATIRKFSPRIKSNNGSRSKSQSLLESSTMLQPTLEVSINAGQKYGQVLEYANDGQLVGIRHLSYVQQRHEASNYHVFNVGCYMTHRVAPA
jgi:predicted component of type VI protein secretion system